MQRHEDSAILNVVAEDRFDLVADTARHLLTRGGVQVLQRIRSLDPAIRVIMITGSNDASLKPTTMSMGAFAYVSKPVSLQHLHDAVSAAFTRPN